MATKIQSYNLNYNSFYIAGLTGHSLFLGNYVARSKIFVLTRDLTKIKILQLKDSSGLKVIWPKSTISIDSPHIYLTEGITPCMLTSSLTDLTLSPTEICKTTFSAISLISPNSYIIKTFDPYLNQYILAKEIFDSLYINPSPNLEKQADGIFSVDGLLSYEPESYRILYVYFYRNQFLCLDTNLNIIFKKNTIDTTTQAKIKVGKPTAEHTLSLSTPAFYVNKEACMTENYIFIHSGLIADNEDRKKFEKSSVIDVYNTHNGDYLFSFYLPDKITSFRVINHTLIAMHDSFISTFHLGF